MSLIGGEEREYENAKTYASRVCAVPLVANGSLPGDLAVCVRLTVRANVCGAATPV